MACVDANRVGDMSWAEYARRISGGAQQKDIALAAGVEQGTVSRWMKQGIPPRPENVVTFAKAYKRPVLEAFVAAGFISADDAKVRPTASPSLDSLSSEDLIQELSRRLIGQPAQNDYRLAAREAHQEIGLDQMPEST